MGLFIERRFELQSGLVVNNIYLRLITINVNVVPTNVDIHCGFDVYLSREAYKSGKNPLHTFVVPANVSFQIALADLDSIKLMPWCYLQYKRLLLAADCGPAVDVLEPDQDPYVSDVPLWQPMPVSEEILSSLPVDLTKI